MITHPETNPAQWGLTLITIFGEQCHPSEPTVRPVRRVRRITEYGPAHGSEKKVLRRDGESLKTRNCVFAVCLAITKESTIFDQEIQGVDGCKRSHHKLLHLSEDVTKRVAFVGDANI